MNKKACCTESPAKEILENPSLCIGAAAQALKERPKLFIAKEDFTAKKAPCQYFHLGRYVPAFQF